ncbi:F-box/kelch-repeat protein At3g06240-like [Euphorbia lathyris]|uniref:F-box/kelch-repeat protein At3g06240-like n=1 Tax=Euphorbia lathyris TaxID=212925 RepID=UPI00331324EF
MLFVRPSFRIREEFLISAMAALPQDVIEDILSRLPVKSLLRFKTVSKKWYSFISENHKFHMKQLSSSSSKYVIFYQLITLERTIFQYSDVDSYACRRMNFPVEIEKPSRLIGSANGLVCVAPLYIGDFFFIWNPCTGECKRISVPVPDHTAAGVSLFGFGYDSISDDYKVLGNWDSHLRFFSLKTKSWKILEHSFEFASAVNALPSNGALHWCVGPQITAFDLANEKIVFLDLPDGIKFVGEGYTSCWVPMFEDYKGRLCASGRKYIWVMMEYDNSKSWAKFSACLPEEYAKPVGISRLGEVVFRTDTGFGFVKSDMQGIMSDDKKAQMVHYGDTFVYKESLISPECFDRER